MEHLVEAKFGGFGDFKVAMRLGVLDANIDIIRATGASRYGIAQYTARIVEAILLDESFVAPVATLIPEFGVPLSVPSVIGKHGASSLLKDGEAKEVHRRVAIPCGQCEVHRRSA